MELIDVEGCIVTADAMSCKKKIVKKITEKSADYTIGLKQNQPALFQDTKDRFETFSKDVQAITQFDKGHGRIEKREYTRYFITSSTDLSEFADSVRKHWSIENQLHWCLDVIFHEDASRARKDNSPLNFNVLRKFALKLASQAQFGRMSKKRIMFSAAINPDFLLKILFNSLK